MTSSSLPLEIQEEIALHLIDLSTLLALSSTSRSWNMATATSLYTSLTLGSFASVRSLARTLSTEQGRVYLASRVRMITLRLPEVPRDGYLKEAEQSLDAIFRATPNLTHLRAPGYPSTPLRLTPHLLSTLPKTIQKIDNLFPAFPAPSTTPPSALSLALGREPSSPCELPFFHHLAFQLPHLTHLSLKSFTSPSLLSPTPIPTTRAFPSLTHLTCSTSPSFLPWLVSLPSSALPNLKEVELTGAYDVDLSGEFLMRYGGRLRWVGVGGMAPWREGLEVCAWQRAEMEVVLGERGDWEWVTEVGGRVGFERRGR